MSKFSASAHLGTGCSGFSTPVFHPGVDVLHQPFTPMRYQLFALVHGRPDMTHESAFRTVPAVVEFAGDETHKRVVAVVDAAHELSGDEVQSTAAMLCCQLERSFSQHGLMLSRPELIPTL